MYFPLRRPPSRRPGTAFIIVLGALGMLAVIISTFVTLSRVGFQASISRNYSARMDMICNGILQQIRYTLARDLEVTQEPFDHPAYDPWLASVNPENGAWSWISRLDMPDTPDPALAAKAGPPGRVRDVAAPVPAKAPGVMDFTNPYYADADGDGIADSILLPVSGGTQFPDGVKAYYAVRIVDNAHFNSRHHVKWERYTAGLTAPDATDGRVDDTPGKPKLPHVNLRGLRNLISSNAGPGDNPDRGVNEATADPNAAAGEAGWDNDDTFDRWLGTDNKALVFDPTMIPPPFTYADDLGIKSFDSDAGITKYVQLWPNTFSRSTTPAIDIVHNNARRMISSVTRTRPFQWSRRSSDPANAPLKLWTPFDLRKFGVDDPALTAAQNQAKFIAQMDQLFNEMKALGILKDDDTRAQYLANLYEYMHVGGGPRYDPIVYRGKIGFTRQVYLSEVIREGDQSIHLNKNGGKRNNWQGRFGVEIYNPYPDPISMEPYTLTIESVLPDPSSPAGKLGYTSSAISMPSLTITWKSTDVIPPFSYWFASTDNNSSYPLPNNCAQIGPRVRVSLTRNIPGVGNVLYDRVDGGKVSLDGGGIDWSDWDSPDTPADQAAWIAAINAGWVNNSNKNLSNKDGVRSAIYRPEGDPTALTPQYPSFMTDEWIGLAATARNQSNLMAPGQAKNGYGSAGLPNPSQTLKSLTAPVVDGSTGFPFIFGYSVTLPKRGKLANLGELARVLTIGNTVTKPITWTFADCSRLSRSNSNNWGPSDNSWAWLNGELNGVPGGIRFNVYDPTPDANGQPYANARLLDLVSLYRTASGKNGPFDPIQYVGDGSDKLDDTDDDNLDVNGDGIFRPAYREGLININTAPIAVLQNLVFPRAYRSGDRVTSGANVTFAQQLYNYIHTQGNAFTRISDIVLWGKTAEAAKGQLNGALDPKILAKSTPDYNYRWDMALSVPEIKPGPLNGCQDYDAPFSQSYPCYPDPPYTATPTWRAHYLDEGYVHHMAERDMIWAGNTNVMTTRSDVFTAYILVKLVRFDPTKPSLVEDLGEARMIALIDRTLCNPITSATAKPVALPRVLALQFTE